MPSLRRTLLASLLAGAASARNVPSNVRDFYNAVSQQQCNDVLAEGFHSVPGDSGAYAYCGDHLQDYGVVYLQGPGGEPATMDIDCHGIQNSPAADGRCKSSGDIQGTTSFQQVVNGYGTGPIDLDTNIHPYVVFGNVANNGPAKGWPSFDPRSKGIQPLSVIAIVCGDKLIYGVWGDENGNDSPQPMVGQASISVATACFGKDINGNDGHDSNDILYIAFPGDESVPGATGAAWNAASYDEFEASITGLGDKLIQRIGGSDYPGRNISGMETIIAQFIPPGCGLLSCRG